MVNLDSFVFLSHHPLLVDVFPAGWVAVLCDHGLTNGAFCFCRCSDECRGNDVVA
jgi:hypothetical protein